MLTFSPMTHWIDVTINITNDTLYESTEEFIVRVELISDIPTLVIPQDTSISLLDDDCEHIIYTCVVLATYIGKCDRKLYTDVLNA